MTTQPALFISDGAPTLAIEDSPAANFWRAYGLGPERPDAAIVVSAHWTTPTGVARVGAAAQPRTIHDFHGFPDALYAIAHPAPGAPALAMEVAAALGVAGFDARVDERRGLDHGIWTPLRLMDPGATLPLIPVGVAGGGAEGNQRLGAALEPFRARNVLVIGSGALTHNLSVLRGFDDADTRRARAYAETMTAAIKAGEDLVAAAATAPEAAWNHPKSEHIDPLFAAWAAGGGGPGRVLHQSWAYGALAMDAFAFG